MMWRRKTRSAIAANLRIPYSALIAVSAFLVLASLALVSLAALVGKWATD
jgi:hypothetical protein